MGLCRRCSIKVWPPLEGTDVGEDAPSTEPDVHGLLFIGPWIVKDLFWSFGAHSDLWGALVCSAIVVPLVGDSLRRTWEVRKVAELIWVTGNTVWVTQELFFKDTFRAVRVLASAILFSGCLLLAVAITVREKAYHHYDYY